MNQPPEIAAQAGAAFSQLVTVMDQLRSPGGCSWDAEQTHSSLAQYLLEETYEVLEALEQGSDAEIREELGDLLLQVVFHSRIAQESEPRWSVVQVVDELVQKMRSRHPHVFEPDTAAAAHVRTGSREQRWQELKQQEKQRDSVTDDIPRAMPALALAEKLIRRASSGQVDEPPVTDAVAQAAHTYASSVTQQDEQAWGQLLLALVAQAHADGVDAESALRQATADYRSRIRAREANTATMAEEVETSPTTPHPH